MPARAAWKGQLRLALVAIPVEIYPAAKSAPQVSFRQIHRKSGQRVRYEKTVPGIGPIKAEDIAKGFEVNRNEYVLLDEEELKAVRLESKRTLELSQFVDRDEIDDMHFDTPYYVVPADELAEEAYIVLREALRRAKVVGLGQLTMRGREHVVALKPCGRGMILETLRYADELNKAASYFRDIDDATPEPEMLELASALIERKRAAFDPTKFRDSYVAAVMQLVEEKRRRGTIATKEEQQPTGSNVIDLMAALRRSVEAKAGRAAAKPKSAPAGNADKPADNKQSSSRAKPSRATPAKSASARKRTAA
jgi:DNA end-binding protein Ku